MQTNYLYHRLPNDLVGTVLYPLDTLKTIYPAVYDKESAKYAGREHIPLQRIPVLNDCLWNDVLFLSAVHPQELFDARRDAGWATTNPHRFIKIDPRVLDQTKFGIYLFTKQSKQGATAFADDFTSYDYRNLPSYSIIPEVTKQYYKEEYERGAPGIKLFFRYIPHVLYKGSIDTTLGEVITVQ